MDYKTKCRLCKSPVTVSVKEEDDSACKDMGIDTKKFLELVVCDDCRFFRETGYRRPPKKSLFHFL